MTPRLAAAVTELEIAHQYERLARTGYVCNSGTLNRMTLEETLAKARFHRQRCYDLRAKRSD